MVSQIIFLCILALVGVQRLTELVRSKRNERALLAQGGREHAPGHYIVMVLIHAGWFVSMLVEVFWFKRPFYPWLFGVAMAFMLLGNWLRFSSMKALGPRWTVRIFTLPDSSPVTTGIYRYVRHPIYLGVIFELAAIPLLHTAYVTSIVFSIANAFLLKKRIYEEERALKADSHYDDAFSQKPSLLPRWLCGRRRE
jgi:methyltransferase